MRPGQTVCYCCWDISDISVGTTNPTCLYNSWGGKKSSKFRFHFVRVPQRPIRTKRTWIRENLEEAPTGEAQLNIAEERRGKITKFDKSKSVECQIQLSLFDFSWDVRTAVSTVLSEREIFCRERPGVVRSHSNKTPDRETREESGGPGKEDCEGVYRNARWESESLKVCCKLNIEILQVHAYHHFSFWKFPESWNSE